jgi:hypothetical protein
MLSARQTLIVAGVLLLWPTAAYPQTRSVENGEVLVTGSLAELRTMRRVLLLVRRSPIVDSRGQGELILKEVYSSDADKSGRFPRTYNSIARRLNQYMTKYRSISGARNIAEAEFIIFFNLLEYRRPLGQSYPYGELYIILNERSNSRPPRIVWKTRKSPIWVEDAIDEFLRDLKATRGEG